MEKDRMQPQSLPTVMAQCELVGFLWSPQDVLTVVDILVLVGPAM
jgi:hypothetical protein